jgi:hypothetical protein
MLKWIVLPCVAGLALAAQEGRVGQEPPELVSERGQWLGSEEALKLRDLKGKVVWMEFGVLG